MSEGHPEGEGLSDIAVVGLAGRFPGAADIGQLWENLKRGIESVTLFTPEELDRAGVPQALRERPGFVAARGVLRDPDLFDAPFFGFSPREARILDPQQRLFLECAWEALESAGCDPARLNGAVGVYAGASQSSYLLHNLASNPDLAGTVSALEVKLGNDKDFLAPLASYRLNLRGPSLNVATACSTSLVAVHLACQGLLNRECDVALAGGVSVSFPQVAGYVYQQGGILSADGHCRAFDAAATGSVGGDGIGIVVLRRLEDALRDGDPVRAVIKGSAINNDGSLKIGFTAPSVDGQAAVIAEAQSLAGIDPATVTYVEAHGTGTPLGDPVEIRALTRAFGAGTGRAGSCAIGSIKANLGHTDAAAGVAGLIKTVLALEHGLIPPSVNFSAPNPGIPFAETPFHVAARLTDWKPPAGIPRRAGVSSFGMGGTNAHAVLEEAPLRAPSGPSRPWQLLVLSAAAPAALEAATDRLAVHLQENPELDLADVAFTCQAGRRPLRHRRMLVCRAGGDYRDAVAALAARDPKRLLTGDRSAEGRRTAFLYPGVGDHYAGMGRGLYAAEKVFRREVDRCAEILIPLLGEDPRRLLLAEETPNGTADGGTDLRRMLGRAQEAEADGEGDRTALLHPAVFVLEMALTRLWRAWGVRPAAVLGYSLGEYAAACAAGVFSLENGLRLVAERARLIDRLPAGAMLAVALSAEELADLPLPLVEDLSLAAENAPDLCVLAGSPGAVEALQRELAARGTACRRLPTTHAFHARGMEAIAEELALFLGTVELKPPQVPLVTGVTGAWITAQEATDPAHWVRHLVGTVRFAAGLRTLGEEPDLALLEVGPGHGLTTLALQQGAGGADRVAVASIRPAYDATPDDAFALGALGRLWLAGVEVDWAGVHAGERRRKVVLPSYPFQRQRYWVEPGAAARGDAPPPAPEKAPEEAPSPLHGRPGLRNDYVPPRDAVEEAIAGHWEEILGLRPVGIHDSFFDLGGHSLLAPRVLSRVRQDFGVEVPIARLLAAPTVAELAALVTAEDRNLDAEPPLDLRALAVLDPAIVGPSPPSPLPPALTPARERGAAAQEKDQKDCKDNDEERARVGGSPSPGRRECGWERGPGGEGQNVLLTGATGFLGAYLLRDLLAAGAHVHCLVRAGSAEEARRRIFTNLESHHLETASLAERITAVPGDLAAPRWGLGEEGFRALAERVGAVYHCGAWVNFTYPYRALAPTNVQGTEEVLRLASLGPATVVHFISSLAVFAPGSFTPEGIGMEDSDLPDAEGLANAYAQTKWVAEKLVGQARERGIRSVIYRPGLIGGDSRTGINNPRDLMWSFVKACLQMEAAPDLALPFDPVPVDFASRAIVHLSRQEASFGRAFHLFNPRPLPWREVFAFARTLGYPLRLLPAAAWSRLLATAVSDSNASEDNALSPFLPLIGGRLAAAAEAPPLAEATEAAAETPERRLDAGNTWSGLAGSGLACPPIDERLLALYFESLARSGFLPAPLHREEALRMKIKFYAHACFRLEGATRTIVTDPYAPKVAWFDPIDEPADLVLMSSNTDRFHCDPSHVQGNPKVVNALEIPAAGLPVDGLEVRAFRARERFQGRLLIRGILPRLCAMYTFTLDGVRVLHTGDIGRKFKPREIAALRGNVDVMFALSGGVHNIEVDDMKAAIDAIGPKVAIPMHYFSPKGRLKILPVDEIAKRFPADRVVRVGGPEIEVTPASLPAETRLTILEQSR